MDAFVVRDESSLDDKIAQIQKSLDLFVERIATKAAEDHNISHVTSGYIRNLSSFIYQFTSMCIARDLIAFRDHAGRRSISEDDALLLARKTQYHQHLIKFLKSLGGTTKAQPRQKRK